ncbi:MAG: dTDP-4-dehydrorhamnose reductase [Candidatus Margulisbacteria bacterium]|nr:dTDP-4-dehydrorhamnose reductase [Candidatus Margulisiibacteriota bacterium]
MRILIIGADGQLGTDLVKVIPKEEQIPLTIKNIDITNREITLQEIKNHQPDIVINTAAHNHVDKCEEEFALAFEINTYGVKYLAEACKATNSCLVHISTDYVFDGKKGKPYVETDQPNPQSIYAISKYAGEQIVKYSLDKYFIIRSTGLYGTAGCLGKGGTNFVESILKLAATQPELKVVTDEILSPTYTLDLAKQIYELVKTNKYGLYHAVSHGSCSWYDFAVKIFELLGRKIKITKTTAAELKAAAKRPGYSALKNAALEKISLDKMRPWQEALKAYLIEKGYLKPA